MRNQRNHPLVRQGRRCVIGVGVATGAVVAAGVVAAATAYADTGADVLGEAGQDLTQATQVLDGAPTASLDAEEATLLTEQEMLQTEGASPLLSAQESLQAGLPQPRLDRSPRPLDRAKKFRAYRLVDRSLGCTSHPASPR